ncbi:hypothetical protein HHK36_017600 [Tetracentron sinense]|uniref:MADS-box domain-containing protein n=1 Tax=Tetracentron sinense TaxID=13715 RepID=A0A835DD82_TETSI|nr:hypothetical protein HHK36_017600 [Tetracentron sinense]
MVSKKKITGKEIETKAMDKHQKRKCKIEIKPIENEDHRQATFSKRRKEIFRKASELSMLSGSNVAAIVFSPAGEPFSFGHPSVDSVLDRFVSQNSPPPDEADREYAEVLAQLEAEKKRREALEEIQLLVDTPVDELGLDDLQKYVAALEDLRKKVIRKLDSFAINSSSPSSSLN